MTLFIMSIMGLAARNMGSISSNQESPWKKVSSTRCQQQ